MTDNIAGPNDIEPNHHEGAAVEFVGTIDEAPRGGAFVVVPPDVVDALGGGKRIPVRASFDGVAYRGSVVSMGGDMMIGLLKGIRAELGKQPGDQLQVTLARDTGERTVDVPEEVRAALDDAGVGEAFDRLSYTRRREIVNSVTGAKKPETRQRRLQAAIDSLR